jgi:hypothetical protein
MIAARLYLLWLVFSEHVPWLRRLVPSLSLHRPGFDLGPFRVGCVVDKVAVGQFSI